MTLKRFIVNNLGKKVDFDGTSGAQCVDLYRQYCKDVLGITQTPALGIEGGAKDIWEKHGELKQSKDSFAVGDVLIYDKTPTNKYGHVCILVSLLDTDNNKTYGPFTAQLSEDAKTWSITLNNKDPSKTQNIFDI